jgi:alpha-galactosidase
VVRVAGVWHGGGIDGDCRAGDASVSCPTGSGTVTATRGKTAADVVLSFTATADVTIEALGLDGAATLPGATSMLSNGFQSWSDSGVLALSPALSDDELEKELARRGDDEVLRDGRGLSWQVSFVGGGKSTLLVGASTAAHLRPWAAIGQADGGDLRIRVGTGGGGASITVPSGTTITGETLRVELGTDPHALLEHYAAALPTRRAQVKPPADVGWNSWYELWDGVAEADVRANATLAAQVLTPYVPAGQKLRITVDDGWEKAWGDWTPNAKFPSGLDGLAHDLTAQGFAMGVWLAPLLASEKSDVYVAHPDWFLPDATYQHAKNGTMRILDVTHPDAAAHLSQAISTIVGWGYSLLKIDFLFAGTWDAKRHGTATGMEAYEQALATIRKAAGESTVLVAVGAPAQPTLTHVDGWRVGPDIALETSGPSWPLVAAEARTLAARYPFCLATLCDADPPLLRKLTEDEVSAGGWVASFAGGALFLSDDLRKLDLARVAWGLDAARGSFAASGKPSVPVDLFSDTPPTTLTNVILDLVKRTSSAVLPRQWKTPDGKTVALVVGEDPVTIGATTIPAHAARVLP